MIGKAFTRPGVSIRARSVLGGTNIPGPSRPPHIQRRGFAGLKPPQNSHKLNVGISSRENKGEGRQTKDLFQDNHGNPNQSFFYGELRVLC
ncbi:hypothetical protein LIER_36390 [Lithospermum erythrorhizon]|uniref:Uncharacterized protein n=1 Tax=Lithospermum erythrorhizon TaxID=34254 RepID=A0AAV3P5G6_LITER